MRFNFFIKSAVLILLVYFYLYNPIFFSLKMIGTVKFILALAAIGLVFHKRSGQYLSLFRKEAYLLAILCGYTFVVAIFGDGTALVMPYMQIVWFAECFIVPVFFMLYFRDIIEGYGWKTLITTVGIIAALITVSLIISPATNIYVRSSVIHESLDEAAEGPIYFRGFTIAESSSYAYGIIQGLICSLCLMKVKENFLYVIPVILIIVSIMFNARIGLSLVAIFIVLFLLRGGFSFKFVFTIFAFFAVGYLLLINSSLYTENEQSFKWIVGGLNSTTSIDVNDDNSNYSILYSMLFLPSGFLGILLGEGRAAANSGGGSDIGFIRHIFVGGLVLVGYEFFFLWQMFRRIIRISNDKILVYLFFITLLIANFKGDAFFVPSGFFRLIAFYYVYTIISDDWKKNNNFPVVVRGPSLA
jgi:hypothetical protein